MSYHADLVKIQDKIAQLAAIDDGNLLLSMVQGPVQTFFDDRNFQDKQALEDHLTESLIEIAQPYGVKQKTIQSYFEDCVKLINIVQQFPTRDEQYTALLEKFGLSAIPEETCQNIYASIEQVFSMKGEKSQQLESLLSQMHYSQLIAFEYKFGITTTDSMIQSNGKCIVNLKMDLLDEQNQRKSLYIELSLNQFYQFFHELKRAYNLMGAM